jgi:hypothetical protein
MKESQGKMNLKTKKEPGHGKKVGAYILDESLGLSLFLGSFKSPKQTN